MLIDATMEQTLLIATALIVKDYGAITVFLLVLTPMETLPVPCALLQVVLEDAILLESVTNANLKIGLLVKLMELALLQEFAIQAV